MIDQIITETNVVIRNFLNICGLSIKNLFGASVVMSMALFPYIYLLAKAQLATMGVSLFSCAYFTPPEWRVLICSG